MYRLKNCLRKYSAKIKNKYEFQITDKYICSCVSTVQGFDEYELKVPAIFYGFTEFTQIKRNGADW